MNAQPQYDFCESRFITGLPRPKQQAAEACIAENSLSAFWRQIIRAVEENERGDIDGAIFTSGELGVCLGPWDVEVKHRYRWTDHPGGDCYMGFSESYAELEERFEIVAVREEDSEKSIPGLAELLNEFYDKHSVQLYSNR